MQENNNIEVRKISTKTYVYMGIIIVLGIIFFLIAQNGKNAKATEVLKQLGYKNVESVRVFAVHDFENMDTRIQGKKYSLKFKNLDTNEMCKGFIIKDYKNNVDKDLLCEKDN
jgi:surface polysaccharide O-acyltransferase-like enzyme